MKVGVRELRDGLSRYLAQVRQGRSVTVTEHSRVIARIVPVGVPTPLERLIEEGRVRRARQPKRPSRDPVTTAGGLSDLVASQRR